mmetsp:Transcript_52843/g.153758  ORF Transcript_52843/g.153758 Transcript_52843/m.153758 type:complete len:283 (-) Transcript_52843:8-856(-)
MTGGADAGTDPQAETVSSNEVPCATTQGLCGARPLESITASVLEWKEVQLSVLQFFALPDLMAAGVVNSSFGRSFLSDVVWRPLCQKRWRGKWGFDSRWERWTAGTDRELPWYTKFRVEEADARRSWVTPEELQSLRFDFRMRLDVQKCISRSMRFGPPAWDPQDQHVPQTETGGASGSVSGHPLEDPRLTWVLDPDGQGLQWGLWPEYWPKGRLRRLPSWGWEVINQNVVLRALDAESPAGRAVGADRDLWADLVDDLVAVRGQGGFLEIPRAWLRVLADA